MVDAPAANNSMSLTDKVAVLVGILFFLFGGGLDLTIIGAPEGVTIQLIGVVLILGGIHKKLF